MKKTKDILNLLGILAIYVSVLKLIEVITNSIQESNKIEMLIGILPFFGSIIVGFITLLGVIYTIKNTEKRESLKKLPGDIYNLNEAIFIITDTIESKLVNKIHNPDDYMIDGALISSGELRIKYTELDNEVTKITPDKINNLLFSIDIVTYQSYLKFRYELNKSKYNYFNKLEVIIDRLMTNYKVQLEHEGSYINIITINGKDTRSLSGKLNIEEKVLNKAFNDFKTIYREEILKNDNEYLNQIRIVYKNLKKSLEVELKRMSS